MDLVTTVEMKELLTSPIIKEAKPVTNGMINQQALDSGIYSGALHERFSPPRPFRSFAFNAVMILLALFSNRGNPKFILTMASYGIKSCEMKLILRCDWLSEQAI